MSNANAFAGPWSTLPIPLTPWILDVIQSMGHSQMTPVQASTIPLFMQHKDVVVEAVTGSGKTLAFVVPILEKLIRREHKLRKNEIGALVISPTRELANQIHSVFSLFLNSQPSSHRTPPLSVFSPEPGEGEANLEAEHPDPLLLVSSSSSPADDLKRFLTLKSDIIVGTPGRVEEFLLGKGRDVVNVKELDVLVLDEADRLLDLGFQQSVTRILRHLPKQRRTGLFSATMTDADALSELVRVSLRNPARIVVKVQSKRSNKLSGTQVAEKSTNMEERRIPANLQVFYLVCKSSEKLIQLAQIIQHEVIKQQSSRFIVYFATCACVDYFYRILPLLLGTGSTLYSLHGHLPPSVRTHTLDSFASAVCTPTSPTILLATDVAARGLDLPDVDVVLQFDPPSDPKAFSHRCGRTARAGRRGRAWVLLVGRERDYVDFMSIRKIPMKERPYIRQGDEVSLDVTKNDREDAEVAVTLAEIRKQVLTDRALHDKAAKAFVSFVRAYSKHEAHYIFRLKDLDLIGVAKCFGLLRLPRMPELQGANRESWEDADVEWQKYSYQDKAKEAKRLADAEKQEILSADEIAKRKQKRAAKRAAAEAWSNKVLKKTEKEKRKEKKIKKRKWVQSRQDSPAAMVADSVQAEGDDEDDWQELAREERMAKKVRRGEATEREFDEEFTGL